MSVIRPELESSVVNAADRSMFKETGPNWDEASFAAQAAPGLKVHGLDKV